MEQITPRKRGDSRRLAWNRTRDLRYETKALNTRFWRSVRCRGFRVRRGALCVRGHCARYCKPVVLGSRDRQTLRKHRSVCLGPAHTAAPGTSHAGWAVTAWTLRLAAHLLKSETAWSYFALRLESAHSCVPVCLISNCRDTRSSWHSLLFVVSRTEASMKTWFWMQ